MGQAKKEDFCVYCREVRPYSVVRKNIRKRIRDKDYSFVITTYVCDCCHHEMGVHGVFDLNSREIDEQYRKAESIVSIEDIRDLMKIFNIGKTPLSLALGFGEITITRYLEGQVPCKEYFDVIRRALSSPSFMKEMLVRNREKIAEPAFRKAMKAAEDLEKAFQISDKMQGAIAYIFHALDEAAPHGASEAALLHSGSIFCCIRAAYVQRDLRGMAPRAGLPQGVQPVPRLQIQSGR